jgi:hypothetical protein
VSDTPHDPELPSRIAPGGALRGWWEEREPAIEAFVNESLSVCPICGDPIRRNQSRRLIGQSEAMKGQQWWKHQATGGTLVHIQCLD